jgi:hypothetical protein
VLVQRRPSKSQRVQDRRRHLAVNARRCINIIPAIVSTNAIIVGMSTPITTNSWAHGEIASCCNEAFKIATSSAAYLNNYSMLIGTEGVYSHTLEHEKRADCPICGGESLEVSISQGWTVERLIEMLVESRTCAYRLPGLCYHLFSVHTARPRNRRRQIQRRTYIYLGTTTARGGDSP